MDNFAPLLSIAPMIDWSKSPFRVLMRFLAPKAVVYTEMYTTGAIQNNPLKTLAYSPLEHPVAIQFGGSDPKALAQSAKSAEEAGYDSINLNLGCPSDKVQAGTFGACLMREPQRVVDCIKAMKDVVRIPVTAKTRIGIDNEDSYAYFSGFAHQLVDAGIDALVVHARKAWLKGLNPKQNRTIPPVQYEYVYSFKKEVPTLPVIINGTITSIADINAHLQQVDGVMLGRLACDNPYAIALIHHHLYPEFPCPTRGQIFRQYMHYMQNSAKTYQSLSFLIKPILNLAFGLPGTRLWKQKLMALAQGKQLNSLFELVPFLEEIEISASDGIFSQFLVH